MSAPRASLNWRRGAKLNHATNMIESESLVADKSNHVKPTEYEIERFWRYTDVRGPNECWNWKKAKNKWGYGVCTLRSKYQRAHRVAFLIKNGNWPFPLCLHSCDNTSCVNPAHLREGTNAENSRDKVIRGRSNAGKKHHFWGKKRPEMSGDLHPFHRNPNLTLKGSKHPMAILDEDKVRDIRILRQNGESIKSLSQAFGVKECSIENIVKRKSWKHVL